MFAFEKRSCPCWAAVADSTYDPGFEFLRGVNWIATSTRTN